MKLSLRSFFAVLLLLLQAAPRLSAADSPKLVLAVVIDQFRYDYLIRFRGDYHAGLARLLNEGMVFKNAHHIHFPTITAVGHSVNAYGT